MMCAFERSLQLPEKPLTEVIKHFYPGLNENEQFPLRGSFCGFATAVVQRALTEHGIETERQLVYSEPLHNHLGKRHRAEHVVLATAGGQIIDPTHSQFMNVVGLTPDLAMKEPSLQNLYPERQIVVYSPDEAEQFYDDFARTAAQAVPAVQEALTEHYPGMQPNERKKFALEFDVIRSLYKSLWNPKPMPLPVSDSALDKLSLQAGVVYAGHLQIS